MKRFFLSIVVLLFCQIMWADAGQTATLHHGDEFKTFFSGSAFKKAMAEAQPGDVITLSPGVFKSVDITVPVTIRGAGIGVMDSLDNAATSRTIFGESFIINVPENEEGHTLYIEGVECSQQFQVEHLVNGVFAKMTISSIYSKKPASLDDAVIDNLTLINCRVDEIKYDENQSITLLNSVIVNSVRGYGSTLQFRNCVVSDGDNNNNMFDNHSSVLYQNCILDTRSLISDAQAFNCLLLSKNNSKFLNDNLLPERNNHVFPAGEQAFIDGSFYRLTEKALEYKGDDGTQVGIYGGAFPFTVKTNYPQIKKFTVSPESGADGKLKIEFEIDE